MIIFIHFQAIMAFTINALDYLRSKTQVDLDGLDIEGSVSSYLLSSFPVLMSQLRKTAPAGAPTLMPHPTK